MTAFDVEYHTAKLFAGLWYVRRFPWFLHYIQNAFSFQASELPDLKGVIVSQAIEGNVKHGWVQSLACRYWVMDDLGFREVAEADVTPWAQDSNAAGDAGRLYSGWARFHFLAEGNLVAVRGTLGPMLFCRMVGRVTVVDGEVIFTDVRFPLPHLVGPINWESPGCPELELRAWSAPRAT